jgi:inosine/xanthosine triphosphate pyrophosphatase family protein
MRDLLLATGNPGKLERLRWVVADLPFRVRTLADVQGVAPAIDEDGADFAANAAQKAVAWSAASGLLTLASDGGLDIPALGARWTALRTRRNAGPAADDAARIRHLLSLMEGLHGPARHAIWHEAVALADHGTLLRTWSARGDGGEIVEHAQPPEGDEGLWTERVRYYPAVGKLYRDLTEVELAALDLPWPRLRVEVRVYLATYLGREAAEARRNGPYKSGGDDAP